MIIKVLLEQFGYLPTLLLVMFIVGVISSGIIEAFDTLNKFKRNAKERNARKRVITFHTWYVILGVCVFTTFIVFEAFKELFTNPETLKVEFWDVVLGVISNVVFAILFYHSGGRRVVKAIVKKLGFKKYEDELGKIE